MNSAFTIHVDENVGICDLAKAMADFFKPRGMTIVILPDSVAWIVKKPPVIEPASGQVLASNVVYLDVYRAMK